MDNEHDWGLPSTHTINAIALGGYVMYSVAQIDDLPFSIVATLFGGILVSIQKLGFLIFVLC